MKKALFLLSLLFPMASWADEATDLKDLLDKVQVLQGQFKQVLKDGQGVLLQESNGSFSLKRPGYFRWESETPYEQLVVGTPEKVWVYDPDLEQVTVRDQNQHNSPASIISGDAKSLRDAFVVTKKVSDSKTEFELSPTDVNSQYQHVSLSFTGAKLTALSFLDKLDQTTQIQFSDTHENKKVKDSLFEFKIPKGVDVVLDE